MNVIFLDFDGVLNTYHFNSLEDVEKRIKIVADICKEYDCKVVVEASSKDYINEKTLKARNNTLVNEILKLFKKYEIECIGRTPNVEKEINESTYLSMWKEDEIFKYLEMHPEVKHYCIIDDDDTKSLLHWKVSDLDKVRNHLVETVYYSNNPLEEGILPKHKKEVGKILRKDYRINDV